MSEAVSQDTATASNDQNTMSFPFSSGEKTEEDPAAKFRGPGTSFRAKLIGSEEVPDSRGDKMCQDSILKLKAIVKASGQHKQKIVINVTLDGIKLIDLMTAQVIQQHSVNKISFIARDQTDRRAFGYVYGLGDGKHLFFGIKTAKVAENVVLSLRDLFNVVYDMKKKEIEAAKKSSEVNGMESTAVQPAVNNMPVHTSQPPQQEGNIFALEQQLENMQEMSNMDAFKSEWNENIPTSPDTPATPEGMNLFGTNVESSATKQDPQYSNDLAGFDMEALEPAADGGAKLTKNQILAGFSQGFSPSTPQLSSAIGPAGGMQQPMPQASPFFGGQQQQAQPFGVSQHSGFGGQPGFGATQQSAFGASQQPAFGASQQPAFGAPNPFGGGQSMGMFSPGPRPVVPARTGAMRPPVANPAPTGASQNPFGDAFGGASSGSDTLLAPANSQPNAANGSNNTANAADPFASLIPGLGAGSADKKDMFKNFQMAKPNDKPTTNAVSANFDDYFMKSVGGVPLDTETVSAPTPTPAPRTVSQDAFGLADSNPTPQTTQNDDPFAAFGSGFGGNSQPLANNTQSLFG